MYSWEESRRICHVRARALQNENERTSGERREARVERGSLGLASSRGRRGRAHSQVSQSVSLLALVVEGCS